MAKLATSQEALWAGDFGAEYTDRNENSFAAGRLAFWSKVLARTGAIRSVIELGANTGDNLRAIRHLTPSTALRGVEINPKAFAALQQIDGVECWNTSLLGFRPPEPSELSFTSGVLIHVNPDELPRAYETLYSASSRFILMNEYYNPSPMTVSYRGQENALFKRDWCAEMRAKYLDLSLVDYGFTYRRDPLFPLDDMTWFLLEKRA